MDVLGGLELGIRVERLTGLIRTALPDAHRLVLLCTELVALLHSAEAQACDVAAALAAGAAVVAAMGAHKANVDAQEMAFRALRILLQHASCEVPLDAVVASMHLHTMSFRLQEAGMVLLAAAILQNAAPSRAALVAATDAVVAAMRQFGADMHLQVIGCQALGVFQERTPDGCADASALDAVVTAMRTHADSKELQEMALHALKNMDFTGAEALEGPLQRALDAVVAAMRAHETAFLAARGCGAMYNLVTYMPPRLRNAFAISLLEAVLAVMQRHPDVPLVQRHGCNLLTVLVPTGSALLQGCAGDAGAVDLLLAVLRDTHAHNEHCLHALAVLYALLQLEANQERATASGALDAVLGAMCARGTDAEVLLLGSRALSALVSEQAHVSPVIQTAATAMRLHPAHVKLQAGFLRMLCGMIDDGYVLHGEPGVIDVTGALVAGCNANCGCNANWRVSASAEHRVLLATLQLLEHIVQVPNGLDGTTACQLGVLEAVVGVITKCSERGSQAMLHEKCAHVLYDVLYHHELAPAVHARAASANVFPAVVLALRAHPDVVHVCNWGASVVAALMTGPAARTAGADGPGALAALVAAMRTQPTNELLQRLGSMAITQLAKQGHDAADEAGALAAVTAALRATARDEEAQTDGCKALSALAARTGSRMAAEHAAAAVRAAVAAMLAHPRDAGVHGHSCAALANLARACSAARVAAREAGALEAIAGVLRGHGVPAPLQVECIDTLLVLLTGNTAAQQTLKRLGVADALAKGPRHPGRSALLAMLRSGTLPPQAPQPTAESAAAAAAALLAEEAAEKAQAAAAEAAKQQKSAKSKAKKAAARARNAAAAAGEAAAAEPAAAADTSALEADAAEAAAAQAAAAEAAQQAAAVAAAADASIAAATGGSGSSSSSSNAAMPPPRAVDAVQPPVEHSRASEEEIASLFPHLRVSDAFDGASASEARTPTATPAAAPTCQPAPVAAPAVSAAAAAAAASATERPMCVICLDAPPCVLLLPCRHIPVCGSAACAAMMGAPAKCPLCRVAVADLLAVFPL